MLKLRASFLFPICESYKQGSKTVLATHRFSENTSTLNRASVGPWEYASGNVKSQIKAAIARKLENSHGLSAKQTEGWDVAQLVDPVKDSVVHVRVQ